MAASVSFRVRTARGVKNPWFILIAVTFMLGLTAWNVMYGFILGIVVSLITLWATRWDWSYFGIRRQPFLPLLIQAIGYTILIFILTDMVLVPTVEHYTGDIIDYTKFDGMRGNLPALLLSTLVMLFTAAIWEEMVFRGYLIRRIAGLIGFKSFGWWIGIALSSIAFGMAHRYQGVSGMIATGIVGAVLGIIYFRNPEKLTLCMVIHGLYNIVGFTLLYFSRESWVSDHIKSWLF